MKTLKQLVLKGTLFTSALIGLDFGTVAASAATVNYGRISDTQTTQSLSSSVLISTVKSKLGAKITYNGHGAFIINNNYPSISIMKSSAYVSEGPLNRYGQVSTAIAVLSFNTYTKKKNFKSHQSCRLALNNASRWETSLSLQSWSFYWLCFVWNFSWFRCI